MKIAYMIYNQSTGRGGHTISLKETILSTKNIYNDYIVINISNNNSDVLSAICSNDNYYNIAASLNPFSIIKKIHTILHNEKVTLIHAFDEFSFTMSSFTSFIYQLNLNSILTKCGGPNPRFNFLYPKAKHQICYSKENLDWFNENNNNETLLIPNRVNALKKRINPTLKKLTINSEFNILCISRITEFYRKKLFSAIKLHNELNNKNTKLFIIGNVESYSLLDELKSISNNNVFFLTSREYTFLSSELIHYFDATVSTGRGAMESLLSNKITFVPVINNDTPSLITINNVEQYFDKNFSNRCSELKKEPLNISEKNNSLLLYNYAKKNFDLSFVNEKYHSLYTKLNEKKSKSHLSLSIILNLIYYCYRQLSIRLKFTVRGRIK